MLLLVGEEGYRDQSFMKKQMVFLLRSLLKVCRKTKLSCSSTFTQQQSWKMEYLHVYKLSEMLYFMLPVHLIQTS